MIRHLEAGNVCVAKSQERDIPPTTLAEKYRLRKYSDNDSTCPHCNKHFKSVSSMKRHIRQQHPAATATGTSTGGTSATAGDVSPQTMANEIQQLKEQIKLLIEQQKAPSIVVNNVSNTNCTFNTNTLNAFGKENIDYIRQSPDYNAFMHQCIKNRAYGLCNYLVARNFHKDHPENYTLAKRVKKDPFIHVYNGEEWQPKMVQDALEQLLAKMEREFAAFADNMDFPVQGLSKRQMDAFMKEVGLPLDWDLSCEKYEYDPEMITDEQKDVIKKRLFRLVLEYIMQYSNKRDVKIS